MRDYIIIGGGASGLIAAVLLARSGKEVTLLEHNEKIGRKLLATGNGKCNFTNQRQQKDCYRGEDAEFAWRLVQKYGPREFFLFLDSIGIVAKEKGGYFYPYSEQASAVVEALQLSLSHYKVKVKCREHVEEILPIEGGYRVSTSTYHYQAEKVILACGGQAAPALGADGSGYSLAVGLGHTLSPLFPALVGLKTEYCQRQKLAGIRAKADIKLLVAGREIAGESGEIQFTAYGISGIAVFQISRYAAHALLAGEKTEVVLCLLPDMSKEDILHYLEKQSLCNGYKTVLQTLVNLMDVKLAEAVLEAAVLESKRKFETLQKEEIEALILAIREFRQPIAATNGYEQAQVTGGGVNTSEVNPQTLESIHHPGVYLVGELLDIDGTCGGYNLQWAFTSAYAATQPADRAN